jgi:hypothetical protein
VGRALQEVVRVNRTNLSVGGDRTRNELETPHPTNVTEIYAEKNLALAAEVASEIG